MAIPTVNATYVGSQPPQFTGQILAFGPGGQAELAYIGTATFVGDGATTVATLNLIDGTNVLPFTPSAIIVSRAGKTADTAAATISCFATGVTATTATISFSAAPANAATFTVAFMILK